MKKIREFISNWTAYLILTVIAVGAFYLRIFRINDLLGFYYDQGRDALVIWKLWHEGRMFLIGPVTGLSGIFLGPFYYYLIAPVYLIGRGNPIYVSVFLAFLSVAAVFIVYQMGKEMHSKAAGLIAATIVGFAYHIINISRWLSNPNPMLLLSLLFFYSLWKVLVGVEKKWWIVAAFLIGISLHFESASAFFYIPVFLIFTMWRALESNSIKGIVKFSRIKISFRKYSKIIFLTIISFLITLVPQVVFNLRHDNILLNNLCKLFS
jgi:4-amino-4-deoxy-L-arabinose transferase-like glycosyltransferase